MIGTHYEVDPAHPLPDAGGGIPAFAAIDRRGGTRPLMALRVDRHAPARPRALHALTAPIDGLLGPLAHGTGPAPEGGEAGYVICPAPTGPSLAATLRVWPEAAILDQVLRPIARILDQLHKAGLTHRAIRPNNVFLDAPNRPIALGAAWAAPPAMHQPAVCEPPYAAMCHPAGRGDGRIADDVYALGILLVTLALGRLPMGAMTDAEIVYSKLETGGFAAVAGRERLPPTIADLARGMLAEDPDHRPAPALLLDAAGARGRRVAARPPAHAQRPLKLGPMLAWNNRTLAFAMAMEPAEALAAIQTGALMYWLRRGLGDTSLAVRLEELPRHDRADGLPGAGAAQVMRAIAAADGLAPLCWDGLALWPDGIGPLLTLDETAHSGVLQRAHDILATEAAGSWSGMRTDRADPASVRVEARQQRAMLQIRGPAGGMPRLAYALNALAPCASPLLSGRWIGRIQDLAPLLDQLARAAPDAEFLDPHIVAFIAARSERRLDQEVNALATQTGPAAVALTAMRLLNEFQKRFHPSPLPGITAWIAARAAPLVDRWHNRERRAAVAASLVALAEAGQIAPMVSLLGTEDGKAADDAGLRAAMTERGRLDAELNAIARGSDPRAALAFRIGQEIAAGAGLAAAATMLILAALR